MMRNKILVIGACGQIGRELTSALRLKYGADDVLASDMVLAKDVADFAPYFTLDVMDKKMLSDIVAEHEVTEIYLLAAMLSARGEQNPHLAWSLNVDGLLNVLEVAVRFGLKKVFWPSSIAVFGPDSEKICCPQFSSTLPTTVYGISKVAGELWCRYYYEKFGLDVRSIRYPGLISYKSLPGGGTTDYAVDIFYKAIEEQKYKCFLKAKTVLPMMYMKDAVRATLMLMDAPAENISIRTAYNLGAMSFSAAALAAEIKKHIPEFVIRYSPDYRQAIADSWPDSIDDSFARKDWAWQSSFGLEEMCADMLTNIAANLIES